MSVRISIIHAVRRILRLDPPPMDKVESLGQEALRAPENAIWYPGAYLPPISAPEPSLWVSDRDTGAWAECCTNGRCNRCK